MAKKFVQNNNGFAIAYYRYSSHAQSEASIEQQREAARNYADSHGLQIIKEYEDAAISGTTDQRPGFQLMLSEVGKIRPAALIIWKTDRLGRDRYGIPLVLRKFFLYKKPAPSQVLAVRGKKWRCYKSGKTGEMKQPKRTQVG